MYAQVEKGLKNKSPFFKFNGTKFANSISGMKIAEDNECSFLSERKCSMINDNRTMHAQYGPALQRKGAEVDPNAPRNEQAIGFGIRGLNQLITLIEQCDDAVCIVGVMARYPIGMNYIKGKGGHAALQIRVYLNGRPEIRLQVGVSATGSIQIEPIFHLFREREGYGIKVISKEINRDACINLVRGVAAEIAGAQPYQERIYYNDGAKTNCSLWVSKMADRVGINLGMEKIKVLPSPNDLQNNMENIRGRDGIDIFEDRTLYPENSNPNTSAGFLEDPLKPLMQNEIDELVGNALISGED